MRLITISKGLIYEESEAKADARCNSSAVLQQFKMWLGGVRPLTIMAIVAMAIIPSVAAADDHKKWGDDSEDERTDNRFVVGNWKHRNEGRRGIESPLALFWRRSNLPTVKIAGENLTR